jgi:REP element-mobilizing transposase RayT
MKNNLGFREFYRRRLPHIQSAGAAYFVTFRLKNSLPKDVVDRLAKESQNTKLLNENKRASAYREWFEKYDHALDQFVNTAPYLRDDLIAEMVSTSIQYRDGKMYELIAYCVMPNHVHVIFIPLMKKPGIYFGLSEILHSLKRHTAKEANHLLRRSGSFWQDESYDHCIRDEAELERIVRYVLLNPVKAGFVDEWKKWKWSYCKFEI